MAIEAGVWGIDLGQCALKALRLENIDGQVTATAFDYVEHPKILSQPDADPDQLIREALEKFLSRNSLRGDLVAISIPGQSGLARFVKLPPVEEKKIGDIVRFEAKQQIPFNLEEVVWDYQKLGSGAVTDGFAMETEIGLFAIKRDAVTRYLQHFKDVNVEVHIVQMAPLALCNFVSYDLLEKSEADAEEGEAEEGKKRCVVALDIGADASNLVITDGQRIIWQRPIPLGGNHFTRALSKDMKLTFAKAEHLKRHATKSPDLKQILSSLKPVLNDFVGEVQRSLGYFTNTHRDAHVEYMVGLGNAFRLPGLQKFLGEKLQLQVRKLQKLERMAGEGVVTSSAYTENVLTFGVAYGLALQGLEVARLHTNLLPQDIQVDRLIRAKKPWAVTAAAALLLGTTVLTIGYDMQHRAVASDPVKAAMKKGKDVKSKADNFESLVSQVKTQIEEHKKAVKSIVFGQDERLNWMEFNKFINTALPRPDGSNLSDEAKKLFWGPLAEDAYNKLKMEEAGTLKATEKTDEEEWRRDLIQANVESVYCQFSDDLSGYYNNVRAQLGSGLLETMSENDRKKPPEGKGWLVEVHGYTYHRKGANFVAKSLVANLARLPLKEVKDSSSAAADQTDPTKAAAATPAAAPATAPKAEPKAATPADPAAENKPEGADANKPSDKMEHPIWNKVSHVVLFKYQPVPNPDPTQFQILGESVISGLATAAEAAPTPGAPGVPATSGPTAPSGGGLRSSWTPLGSGFTSSGGSGSFGSGGGGGPGFGKGEVPLGRSRYSGTFPTGRPGGPGGPGAASTAGPGYGRPAPAPGKLGVLGGGGAKPVISSATMGFRADRPLDLSASENEGKKALQRTEFIITFIWKEPTPSDALLPQEGSAETPEGSPDSGGGGGATPGGAAAPPPIPVPRGPGGRPGG
ncbi:MAG TPA: type IV pilus assembly protein PilM [Gemmataceae bacterium]|nr:type IV pilus assembly protein PilM [Gemmataceae bacterium]